jgi:hypothetical protein
VWKPARLADFSWSHLPDATSSQPRRLHQAGATKELNRIEFEESGDGISAVFLSLRFNTEHRRYVDLMAIR